MQDRTALLSLTTGMSRLFDSHCLTRLRGAGL